MAGLDRPTGHPITTPHKSSASGELEISKAVRKANRSYSWLGPFRIYPDVEVHIIGQVGTLKLGVSKTPSGQGAKTGLNFPVS